MTDVMGHVPERVDQLPIEDRSTSVGLDLSDEKDESRPDVVCWQRQSARQSFCWSGGVVVVFEVEAVWEEPNTW